MSISLKIFESINLNKFSKRVLFHVLFWSFYVSVFTFQGGYYRKDYIDTFIGYLYFLPILMLSTYFTNYILVPKLLLKKKYALFVISLILSIAASVILTKLLYYFVLVEKFYSPQAAAGYYSVGFFYPTYLISHAFNIYTIVSLFGFLKFVKIWFINQQINQKLENEKLEAEIKFLRAQVNPHFLFNVLNNIYSLSLKKSDRTPEMILRLSSMLDFLLYETNADFITLEKELKLINDYIELEKLRYGNRLDLSINMAVVSQSMLIAPLVLFPFIENSFKHGASNELTPPWIKILLNADKEMISLKVINSKSIDNSSRKNNHSEGIGIHNVQRRLELIYPGRYLLEIKDENTQFSVHLNIRLKGE